MKLSQTQKIGILQGDIECLQNKLKYSQSKVNALLKENQDLENELKQLKIAAEERLKIIKSMPDLNCFCEVRQFESKVRT